jgi:DNA-binding FadR family transcriptional regulator|tara:strand:- start:53 stop:775 length:723 start_codon:yes stop_codon:yes gene_type:complete
MYNLKIEVENKTLVDLVEEKLLNYFKEANIMPGDSIPTEAELVTALGVGRSVLREALSRFRMLGLVKSRTRRGMILSEPSLLGGLNKVIEPSIMSEKNIKEILGLRIALEIGNAYLIIKHITDEDMLELDEIAGNYNASGYNKFTVDADHAFHSKLHEIAGNEVISKYQEIFYKVFVYTDKNFSKHFEDYNKKISKDQLVTHRDLLKKLKERDVSGFQDLMLKHLTLYVDFIDSNAENTN